MKLDGIFTQEEVASLPEKQFQNRLYIATHDALWDKRGTHPRIDSPIVGDQMYTEDGTFRFCYGAGWVDTPNG